MGPGLPAGMLGGVRTIAGDRLAVGSAVISAQWRDTARALDWPDTAVRDRAPYLT
jgi:hypothetical protein